MYDPAMVLAQIDQNKVAILALCGAAMICNYGWFFAAVRQGWKDRVYPMPVFASFFWLIGDGSSVVRYFLKVNPVDHWFVNLFCLGMVVTALTELVFVYLILRFGRQELAPQTSAGGFTALMAGGFITILAGWLYIVDQSSDPLMLTYFNLANLVGPLAAAGLILRRGTRAGTSVFIWIGYATMLAFWFSACSFFLGPPFDTPAYIAYYLVTFGAALGVAALVRSLPAP